VTTDFFTPVVDDPRAFGAIAAANALADLYAMGAQPFLALNVAAMPLDLDPAIIREILRGGAEIVKKAGAVLAGGHSVQDKEPKYGLVALGFADPDKLFTKAAGQPGDRLILTKPLGTGVTTTALMHDKGEEKHEQEAVEWMTKLNGEAAQIAHKVGVRAATDISGFGLLGHALELADASGVGLRFNFESIPLLSGARAYAEMGTFPGGSLDNRSFFGDRVRFDEDLSEAERMLLFDAQTSGGLLIVVREAAKYMQLAQEAGISAWVIGEITGDPGVEVNSA
jgi:selenide,water dikinase